MHLAAYFGQHAMVDHMLQLGLNADCLDQDEATPLMLACAGGHIDTMELLLRYGADVHLCDYKGWSPVLYAAFTARPVMVLKLVNDWAADATGCTGDTIEHGIASCVLRVVLIVSCVLQD